MYLNKVLDVTFRMNNFLGHWRSKSHNKGQICISIGFKLEQFDSVEFGQKSFFLFKWFFFKDYCKIGFVTWFLVRKSARLYNPVQQNLPAKKLVLNRLKIDQNYARFWKRVVFQYFEKLKKSYWLINYYI